MFPLHSRAAGRTYRPTLRDGRFISLSCFQEGQNAVVAGHGRHFYFLNLLKTFICGAHTFLGSQRDRIFHPRLSEAQLRFTLYSARQKNGSQVARILFLLLLTTSAWPCLNNSRNLGTIFLPGPVCAEQDQACHIDDVLTTHAQRSIHRVNLQFRTHNSIKETVTPFQHHTTGTNTPGFCNAIQYRIGGISKYVKRRRKIGAVSNPEILDSEACSCIESFYGSKTKNVRNLIPQGTDSVQP